MRPPARRLAIALVGSIAGTCLGLVAFLGLRACARIVVDHVETGSHFAAINGPENLAGVYAKVG